MLPWPAATAARRVNVIVESLMLNRYSEQISG